MEFLTLGPRIADSHSKGDCHTSCEAGDAGQLPGSKVADAEIEHGASSLTAYEIDQDEFLHDRWAKLDVADNVPGGPGSDRGTDRDEHLEIGKRRREARSIQ